MRVRARKIQANELSPRIQGYIGQNQQFLTHANEYEVHAMSFFDGLLFLQIIDDTRFPAWVPSSLFEQADTSIPSDWKCTMFPRSTEKGILMLLGPDFIVRDEKSYQEMVELDADQVDRFWKRIDSLSEQDDSARSAR
jgi:hypothetical protein